jgi:hypothetical protein
MSITKKIEFTNLKNNYFNILYILIMPSFVLGQAAFKFILLLIIFSAIILFKGKIFHFKKNMLNILFLITLVYFIFNSLIISNIYYDYNNRYLTFIFIFLFYLSTDQLFKKKLINFQLIFKFNIFIFLFIYIDTIYQIIFKKNLFGFEYYQAYERYSGPFGDEFILGAFMSFFLLPSFLIYLKENHSNKFKKIFIIFFLFLSIYIALKIGERIAFLTIMFQLLMCLIIFKFKNKKYYVFSTFIISLIIILIMASDKGITKKYEHFYNTLFNYELFIKNNKKENVEINKIGFLNSQTGAHFLTALKIWEKNPILGVGIKNFRYESRKEIYSTIKSHQVEFRVSTHPHNFQLELLSETGIVGFLLFNLFIIYLFYKILKNFKIYEQNNYFLFIFFILIFSKYFPFKTDSSLYSSSMGLLFWIFLIFLLTNINKSFELK